MYFCLFQSGRLDSHYPKVCGHQGNVLDIKWNPFFENIVASCSEDASVRDPQSFLFMSVFLPNWLTQDNYKILNDFEDVKNVLYLWKFGRCWGWQPLVQKAKTSSIHYGQGVTEFVLDTSLGWILAGSCSGPCCCEPLSWKWHMTDVKWLWARLKSTGCSVTDYINDIRHNIKCQLLLLLISDVTWHTVYI